MPSPLAPLFVSWENITKSVLEAFNCEIDIRKNRFNRSMAS